MLGTMLRTKEFKELRPSQKRHSLYLKQAVEKDKLHYYLVCFHMTLGICGKVWKPRQVRN